MIISVIGIIIGLFVLAAGIWYLMKEKDDPESKKIYMIVSVIGAVVTAIAAVMLYTHF